jgi:hypothetical protein
VWHHFTLIVPAGTKEDEPVEKELNLTYGVIKHIGIPWDMAANRLVKVRLLRFRHQIFPINTDEPACGSGNIEGGEEHLELLEFPFVLTALGYAPDTSYDHEVTILINVLPLLVAEPWRAQPVIQSVEVPWLTSV